jgi:hypothetical protein
MVSSLAILKNEYGCVFHSSKAAQGDALIENEENAAVGLLEEMPRGEPSVSKPSGKSLEGAGPRINLEALTLEGTRRKSGYTLTTSSFQHIIHVCRAAILLLRTRSATRCRQCILQ